MNNSIVNEMQRNKKKSSVNDSIRIRTVEYAKPISRIESEGFTPGLEQYRFLADFDRTPTRGQISYLSDRNGGILHEALQLYEKNMAVSEALIGYFTALKSP